MEMVWCPYHNDGEGELRPVTEFYGGKPNKKWCNACRELHRHHVLPKKYFVYLAGNEGLKRYKVGMTTNLEERLATLQTGAFIPLKMLRVIPLKDKLAATELEAFFLRKYAENHLSGEWFRDIDPRGFCYTE